MVADEPVTLATFDRLPARQRDVLGLVAIGQDGGHHPATLRALERRGLIVGYREHRRLDGLPLLVQRWEVPIPVHVVWCAWCSIHAPAEEAEE